MIYSDMCLFKKKKTKNTNHMSLYLIINYKTLIFFKKVLTNGKLCDIIALPLIKGAFFVCFWDCTPPRGHRGRYSTGLTRNLLGGAEMRVKITLACTDCKQRNYDTKKNKKNDPDRLEMKKYCRFCRKHTLHKETK